MLAIDGMLGQYEHEVQQVTGPEVAGLEDAVVFLEDDS